MLKRTESFMKMKAAPALINLWRELDGDDAWQAAFDNVLAGVDVELVELVAYLRYGEPVELDAIISVWNEYKVAKGGAHKSVYVDHPGYGYWPAPVLS